jgi:hypothetical protein
MKTKIKLIPPDRKQCQAMIRSGCFPTAQEMFIMGPSKTERCENKPECIVTEKKPNKKDGQRGSMSLCGKCFVNFIHAFGGNHADVEVFTKTPTPPHKSTMGMK